MYFQALADTTLSSAADLQLFLAKTFSTSSLDLTTGRATLNLNTSTSTIYDVTMNGVTTYFRLDGVELHLEEVLFSTVKGVLKLQLTFAEGRSRTKAST